MAKSGFTKEINTTMYAKGYKGYIQWNDGSINYYKTRAIAKRELRKDVNKHRTLKGK